MVYNKINKLRKKQRNQTLLAQAIGMTVQGLNLMMKKRTMTVDTLEKIAHYFEVTPASLFDEDGIIVHDPKQSYKSKCSECSRCEAQLELMMKILKEKDEALAHLNRELGSNCAQKNKEAS